MLNKVFSYDVDGIQLAILAFSIFCTSKINFLN